MPSAYTFKESLISHANLHAAHSLMEILELKEELGPRLHLLTNISHLFFLLFQRTCSPTHFILENTSEPEPHNCLPAKFLSSPFYSIQLLPGRARY